MKNNITGIRHNKKRMLFMRRFISLMSLITFALSSNSITISADSSSSHNHFVDDYIRNIVCQEYDECDIKLEMKKEVVYDIYLEKFGYVYEFNDGKNINGYLVLKKIHNDNNWEYSVSELAFDTNSPYNDSSSKNIYLGYGMYFEYKHEVITDSITNEQHNYNDVILRIAENFELLYPKGGTAYYEEPVTYNFTYMTKSETITDYGYPLMSTAMGYLNQDNNCSPTAGVSIALFWDKYYSNLVPNVSPTKSTSSGDQYKKYSDYIDAYPPYVMEKSNIRSLHNSFYNDMQTNTYVPLYTTYGTLNTGIGTVPSKFYSVLEDYFDEANLTLQHYDIIESADDAWGFIGESMTSSNWIDYKNQIDLNRPVVIQLGVDWSVDFTLIKYESHITENSTSITYKYREYPSMSAHTVVGYGYRVYKFYQPHPYYGYPILTKIDNFMVVANGWGGTSYVNASDNDIGMAYSVYVN